MVTATPSGDGIPDYFPDPLSGGDVFRLTHWTEGDILGPTSYYQFIIINKDKEA